MKENPAQHREMPNIMAPPEIVEPAWQKLLRHSHGIHHRADDVHDNAHGDGRVEIVRPRRAAGDVEFDDGNKTRGAEGDVKRDAGPGFVFAVEVGVPRHYDAAEAEDGGGGHVDPAAGGLAVEGGVLGRHYRGGDQEGYAGVVDAGEAFEQGLVGDAVHCVPHAAADETFAGGDEE